MPDKNNDLEKLVTALLPVAKAAGTAIMDIYNTNPEAETKIDGSPVTAADRAAEAIILPALKELAPDIPVISEENTQSHTQPATDMFFLVDPLDGTREFLKRDGKGAFTVNIALITNKVPVLGVIYAPALNRLFWGTRTGGAFEDGKPLRTEAPRAGHIIAVASASHRDEATNAWLAANRVDETISIGSSLKFCLIATNQANVYPRFGPTMEWDTAAGDAILRAAGGCVLTPEGDVYVYGKPAYKSAHFIARGQSPAQNK